MYVVAIHYHYLAAGIQVGAAELGIWKILVYIILREDIHYVYSIELSSIKENC